jgi:hypothetical protein
MDSQVAQPDPVAAARNLTAVLATLAESLAKVDVEGVLHAELALTTALASIRAARETLATAALDGDARKVLAAELGPARAALARCAALGVSLDTFVRGRGYAAATYGPTGGSGLGDSRTSEA